MGNEGTQWIGMADFVARKHFVQNLGDGTYFHSGQLAIQAAVGREGEHHLQAALQRHRSR
jgi:TPP-dependent indolepyruvate ferredoxin oxidoreductase alpha subunit